MMKIKDGEKHKEKRLVPKMSSVISFFSASHFKDGI